ncbi:hypothetical protein [Natrarchaeobius oligotrophus]|uniref:Uncharacterized protein n=1 Tax=Natrarchaeobius chitinivorans TaxID=1679083 RepID=A0A3N6PB56_NATCH|nr:hypothetical protein [Natrarchaeobius chitinivorans]RQG93735.1 hypothetical protein EA472_22640 [Natrarchaeobius chitinivorans]
MPVSTLPSAEKYEENGWAEIEFVGFRYTGPQSTKTDRNVPRRAGYAGPPKFQRGRTYFGLLPTWLDDDHIANSNIGVHALEARSDFEVIYDAGRLAEALLERNYLPPDVFYEGFDRWKRQKVLEKLDLDDAGRVFDKDDEEPYRDQLREIAGIERDDEAGVSQQRADEYTSRFSRSELSAIVGTIRKPELDNLEAPFDPGECTIDELEDRLELEDDQLWDIESLYALREAERDGKDRTGAIDAIEDAIGDGTLEIGPEIDLETAGQTEMAEYLTRFEPAEVEAAIDEALSDDG